MFIFTWLYRLLFCFISTKLIVIYLNESYEIKIVEINGFLNTNRLLCTYLTYRVNRHSCEMEYLEKLTPKKNLFIFLKPSKAMQSFRAAWYANLRRRVKLIHFLLNCHQLYYRILLWNGAARINAWMMSEGKPYSVVNAGIWWKKITPRAKILRWKAKFDMITKMA